MKKTVSIALTLAIPIAAVVGARLDSQPVLYAMLGLVCVAVILVAFNRISERAFPYLTYAIALALLWQTSLISNGLVGTDIHTEYYFYWATTQGGWDYTIPHAYNSAVGTTVLTPFLVKALHIDGYSVYKVIYPMLFALVPLLLYYVFRKEFNPKTAFLSVFFFVAIPTYLLEVIGLPRQQLAELMLAVVLFMIMVSKWRMWIRLTIISAAMILGILFHYVTGPLILLYVGGGAVFLLLSRRRQMPVKYLLIIVVAVVIAGIAYYSAVTQGVTLYNIAGGLDVLIARVFNIQLHLVNYTNTTAIQPPINTTVDNQTALIPPYILPPNFGREPLLNTALGLDFLVASPVGKVFRIFQYITQGLLALGVIALWRERKQHSAEYLALVAVTIVLMGLCVFVPRFSNFLNLSRYYHFALFLLAPMVILGGKWLLRDYRVLVLAVLIPYFLFTSGIVCEAAKVSDISSINVPYSYALSHDRLDIGAVATDNDLAVRDYIAENGLYPIYCDVNGMLILSEKIDWQRWNYTFFYVRREPKNMLNEGYIYMREVNTERQGFTLKPIVLNTTSGMREFVPFEAIQIEKYNLETVFQSGDAQIIKFTKR